MKIRVWHKIETWNLKIFFSISAGLHLIFLSAVALFFPELKIDRLPSLNIEVSLLPVVAQEKVVSVHFPTLKGRAQFEKEEKKSESPLPSQAEIKVTPMDGRTLMDGKLEISNKAEEKVKKEPIVPVMTISLNPETVVTFQADGGSESHDSALSDPSSLQEQMKLAKSPFLPDGEILFIQPKYAENPIPPYPQEARKRGYQGEVILKVEVLSNGRVGQIEVKRSSGHETLDRSALAAVKEWKFIPARKGEDVIPSWVNIPIRFQLQ